MFSPRQEFWHLATLIGASLLAVSATGCAHAMDEPESNVDRRLYLIGQDLGAIRGYQDSGCCLRSDGGTAYLDFFALLDQEANYGGLGLDADLKPIESEQGWGSGPVSAWKTARETHGDYLAKKNDI